MFNPNFFDNDICQFADAVSEPILLSKFIEGAEDISGIDNIISKWEIYENKSIKNINAYNVDLNEPRSLYIVNSIYSGMKFCLDKYVEMKQIPGEQILSKSFTLQKQVDGSEINSSHYSNTNAKYIIMVFLNDDYQGGEIVFPKKNMGFKPQKGSIVIFPNKEDLYFQFNKINNGERYMTLHYWSN